MDEIKVYLHLEEDIPAFSRLTYAKKSIQYVSHRLLAVAFLCTVIGMGAMATEKPHGKMLVLIALCAASAQWLGQRIEGSLAKKLEVINARVDEYTLRDVDHIMSVVDLRNNAFAAASRAIANGHRVNALLLYRKIMLEYAAGRGAIAEMQELRALADKRN